MLTTKRYDYIAFELVQKHPLVENHRPVNPQKVAHYQKDILRHGLLEPLVVWERNPRELFLVGGFHRHTAITRIRAENPGYYDRVDVRIVTGELEEIRALNLKLNADHLAAKVVEYFDTVVFLNNANWTKERIAAFLDKSVGWIEEILRFAPSMDPRIRVLLENERISWAKAKAACRRILDAAPGDERTTADAVVQELESPPTPPRRPLSAKSARRRLAEAVAADPQASYTVRGEDLLSLLTVLTAPTDDDTARHVERVRRCFPELLDAAEDQTQAGERARAADKAANERAAEA
ncbi:MAG: ParB/RepB/Spo0J family partition protein [bacterium]|nr:ParB/RepB/Spo0J family partition protein [bacterium]